ncbi:RNA polymerase sigma factor [Patulibacter americanus]|uniref:RNA polymerase sigma factor n=1 Tax=Patulibacter americanus TaxID=588672 RepID=UPI0003B301C3|nr:sigma-70 family RNA polymerase sigma factor [Patulibacter americanus]
MPDSPSADLSDPPARPLDAVGARPRPLPGARPRSSTGGGLDAARTLEDNARAMLRVARRYSYCEDDAHDAVQAAAERFLKHQGEIVAETATGWLVTVARNEALRVRERRGRTGAFEDDDDRRLVHTGDGPEDLASRGEELSLAREALGRLKPQERLALWLQAEGRSYDEIAAELDWSRTKVNRNIAEGRASLRKTLAGIAMGESCAAAGPRIDRLASGHASRDDLAELRPHLRRCSSCRGRLRRARGGRWGTVPPVLLAWTGWLGRAGQTVPAPARPRVAEVVAERLALLVPASAGAVTEAGLALTAGVAAVALGAGVVAGGTGQDAPPPAERRAPSVARAAASPAPSPAVRPVSPVVAALGASVAPAGAARTGTEAAARAAERRQATRAAERRAERAARRRAAVRRAAARRAAARRAAARRAAARRDAAARSAAPSGPAAPVAPAASAPAPTPAPVPAAAAPSGGGTSSRSGAASTGGSAADEFGFE